MKNKRQLKILNLIKNEVITTQEELVERLEEKGIKVTQATVSRDIKKLGLIKIPDEDGGYKYALANQKSNSENKYWLKKMFNNLVADIDFSDNIILLKTVKGTAGGLGEALDNANWKNIIGSVAGDDTLLLIIKPVDKTEDVFDNLKKLME
ncbi:MAG: arginine repressor [Halanaerobiales bacterium]|nr:arginine repressor [Halanaerobiales bacterium]